METILVFVLGMVFGVVLLELTSWLFRKLSSRRTPRAADEKPLEPLTYKWHCNCGEWHDQKYFYCPKAAQARR